MNKEAGINQLKRRDFLKAGLVFGAGASGQIIVGLRLQLRLRFPRQVVNGNRLGGRLAEHLPRLATSVG